MFKITANEREGVVDLLQGAIYDMYNDSTVENLDQVLRACEEALAKVKQLRRWAEKIDQGGKMTEEQKFQLNVDGTAVCPFCTRLINPTHQIHGTKMLIQWHCGFCHRGCVVEAKFEHVGQFPFIPPHTVGAGLAERMKLWESLTEDVEIPF